MHLKLCLSRVPFRKDQNLVSTVNCWYLVLEQTRRESRDHATLSDIYNNNVIVRLAHVGEDVIRLFKKVRVRAGWTGLDAPPPVTFSNAPAHAAYLLQTTIDATPTNVCKNMFTCVTR